MANFGIKKPAALFFVFFFLCLTINAEIVVTSPSSREVVKSCPDYAYEVLQDPWDMNERTDLGWRIFNTYEEPKSYLSNSAFLDGIYSATTIFTDVGIAPDYSDVNIAIVDSAYGGTGMLGKNGINYPINADKYTTLTLRMYLEPEIEGKVGQLFWSKDPIYSGVSVSGAIDAYNGWKFYTIDIPALGKVAGEDYWSGLIDSLRYDPISKKDKLIQIDWIRLVEHDTSTERIIQWTGNSGNVDIYLDNDNNSANGVLGLLEKNISGNSHNFLAGGLMPGDYYVVVVPTGESPSANASTSAYSGGYYHVNDVPTFAFTKPTAEGSDEDFMTVKFSDPWDMANSEDVEETINVQNPQFTTIDYEDLAGNVYRDQTVFLAESTTYPPPIGDPVVYFFHFLSRGKNNVLDTSKYHNLTLKMGIWGEQSYPDGSRAQLIWKNDTELVENVSKYIVIRQLPGKWLMNKIVTDLNDFPLADGAGSPSHTGWNGELDAFRIDPLEFNTSHQFFFDEIRLTSDWSTQTNFQIEWTVGDLDGSPTVSLYYDTDNSGFNGVLIAGSLTSSATNIDFNQEASISSTGSYLWDVSGVPDGTYWLYAVVTDGTNQNQCYATGPLIIGDTVAQITVESPSTRDVVKSSPDYAYEMLQDPWDMNERTDLGWRTFNTAELPQSFLTNISFTDGIFSGQSQYSPGGTENFSDANITILDSGYPGSAFLGKIGTNFPINADKYTILVLRMNMGPDILEGKVGQLLWSKNTIYPPGGGSTTSGAFDALNGWYFYMIDIPALSTVAGSDAWNGFIDSLRMDPLYEKDKTIQIDWMRLVENSDECERTITWTGNTGTVDIYLDNDNNPGNGNLGLLAKRVDGQSYTFLTGALLPGDYYVAIAPRGTTDYGYSSGYFHVNDVPILRFTKPSAEGSDKDFMSVTFSDPWDMGNAQDVEHTENIHNPMFDLINYNDLAGNSFTNQSVYIAESDTAVAPLVGDPTVFFLHFVYRGKQAQIDPNKYHNLSFNMGIEGTQSVYDGSIARVLWKRNDEEVENVSQDIIIRHLPSEWTMSRIICDLKFLPLEEGSDSPSHSGWTGLIDSFRIDPHEFSPPRRFFFDDIKITADWKADATFNLEWVVSDSDSTPSVSIYQDNNNSGYDGTLLASAGQVSTGAGSYLVDMSSYPEGKYWIYAELNDGTNQNRSYAGGPIIVDHSLVPEIQTSKSLINLGAERLGPSTTPEQVLISNVGDGTLNWEATPSNTWMTVSPLSGSGDAFIDVSVTSTDMQPGSYSGNISITDSRASNTPKIIGVDLTVKETGTSMPPIGVFASPVNGTTVSSSIGVTGWVLDDIGVESVKIYRDPVAGEGGGAVYIGDADFVVGARPDVELDYPDYPQNYQAGWGYMMLTNFLPNGGNGTFVLYALATDVEGNQTLLSSAPQLPTVTITCDNINAVKPFGAMETPTQGGPASGSSFRNWAWVLTPQPNQIPTDGSTIEVFVNGVKLGNPVYNNFRQDVYDLFSDYENSSGAFGYFDFDTTTYTNDVHSIYWVATDDGGNQDGIGSRYFEIENIDASGKAKIKPALKRYPVDQTGNLRIKILKDEESKKEKNIHSSLHGKLLATGERQMEIEIEELVRIEIPFESKKGTNFICWGKIFSQGPPIGSTLNPDTGVFYWTPGPGFLGKHVLHFAVTDGQYRSKSYKIIVNIVPKTYR